MNTNIDTMTKTDLIAALREGGEERSARSLRDVRVADLRAMLALQEQARVCGDCRGSTEVVPFEGEDPVACPTCEGSGQAVTHEWQERALTAERELAEARGRLAAVEALVDEWEMDAHSDLTQRACAALLRATLSDTSALDRVRAEAKAEALREAADEMVGRRGTNPHARFLRDRAAALTSDADA